MEILKNKKVLIGGAVVLALVGYWYWSKDKAKKTEEFSNADGGTSKVKNVRVCDRINEDGSHTQYTPHGGSKPCPSGGKITQFIQKA